MSMHLARCLAEGRDCGEWKVPKARRVLYVDGEMALDALRERDRALRQSCVLPLHFLSHYQHFDETRRGLNLTDVPAQKALLDECERLKIEVLILDNLSCLFSGMRENEADSWGMVFPWLLDFRHRGIAVCIVHHAGRNGLHMRGTSRREDAADWVMQVSTPSSEDKPTTGHKTQLITQFTKSRDGSVEDEGPWQWTFETPAAEEPTTVHWGLMTNLDALVRCVEDGLELCSDIVEELGLSKSAVSKLARKAAAQNRISIDGRGNQSRYFPIAKPQFS